MQFKMVGERTAELARSNEMLMQNQSQAEAAATIGNELEVERETTKRLPPA